MPIPRGWNPLNWDCETQGCFNVHMRPAIELFADCFPRACNFGDTDAPLVELNKRFLLLEWKRQCSEIPEGQRRTYEAFSSYEGFGVFVVIGDPRLMTVDRFCKFKDGKQSDWCDGDLHDLKRALRGWTSQAVASSRVSEIQESSTSKEERTTQDQPGDQAMLKSGRPVLLPEPSKAPPEGHPCFVCGEPDAPFSYDNGWTYYCRDHMLERADHLKRLDEAYARDAAAIAGVCKACDGGGCPTCQPKRFGIGGYASQ